MDVLNSDTLLQAMEMCEEYEGANICIAFKSARSVDAFVSAIYPEINAGLLGSWTMREGVRGGYTVLKSKNDSFIHLIDIHDSRLLKGRAFHWVLYDDEVDKDLLQLAASTERLPPLYTIEESEELDDFLNSFKIVSTVVKPL